MTSLVKYPIPSLVCADSFIILSRRLSVRAHGGTKDLPNLSGYFQVSQAFVNRGQQSETDSSALRKLTAN